MNRMNVTVKVTVFAVSAMLMGAGTASAMPAHVDGATSNMVTVNGASFTLVSPGAASVPADYSGIMWEETATGSGVYKACLCSMVSFRALQAVGQFVGLTAFNTDDITISTGWNTDGPERVYDEIMGWDKGDNFFYADSITDFRYLNLDDAWFTFDIEGIGEYRVSAMLSNYQYTDDTGNAGYHAGWDMFDYRTAVQAGTATNPEKAYFQNVIRPQIAANLAAGADFDVTPVPIPGAVWLLGSGMAGLVFTGRRKKQ